MSPDVLGSLLQYTNRSPDQLIGVAGSSDSTTSSSLRIAERWRPWQAVWRDEHGRPRTLNPYAGQELVWRFQESPPPAYSSLEQAIAAWESGVDWAFENLAEIDEWFEGLAPLL